MIIQVLSVLAFAWVVGRVLSECNICQTNQAACMNSTSFYLCFGDGTPHTDRLYTCLDGFQCSDKAAICVQKNAQTPPSCGDTSKCGLCSAQRNFKFACQSQRLFQMCYGAARPTGPLGTCPPDTVCDADSDQVCVPKIDGQTLTCDLNDDLVSNTSTTPTTEENPYTKPTADPNTRPTESGSLTEAQQVCKLKAKAGLYETVPRDPYCKRYINCYFIKGQVRAMEYSCTSSSYFEAETQSCSYRAPADCVVGF